MRIPLAVLGLTGAIGSLVLMREWMTLLGGSFHGALAALAASWLWMAVGAWLAEYRSRGVTLSREAVVTWARPHVATLILVAVLLPLKVALLRALPEGQAWGWAGMGLILLLAAPLNLLLGAQYALGRRLLEIQEKLPGWAFFHQAIGAAVGGMLFDPLLVPLFNVSQIMLLMAALNLMAGWWMGGQSRLSLAKGAMSSFGAYGLGVLAIALGAMALPLGASLEQITLDRQWPAFTAVQESRQGRTVTVEREDRLRLFWSGALFLDLPDEETVGLAQRALVLHPQPHSILLVGGGPETLKTLLAGPSRSVYVAGPDLQVTARWQIGETPGAIEPVTDSRVIVVDGDARMYLARQGSRFDLILVALPGPTSAALNRYYTAEFWALARQALAPGGVVVARLAGAEARFAGNDRCLAAVGSALARHFPAVSQTGQAGDPDWALVGTLTGTAERGIDAAQTVNTDLSPACPAAGSLWPVLQQPNLWRWLVRHGWLLLPLAFLLALGWLKRGLRLALLPVFVALGSGGLLAGAMIGLQTMSGAFYSQAGLLLAVFFGGLALAGAAAWLVAIFSGQRQLMTLLAAAWLVQIALLLTLPGLIDLLAYESLLPWLLTGWVGQAGTALGLALAAVGLNNRPGAAYVSAMAGGALGLALVGLLVIPSGGMIAAVQAAALCSAAGLFWLRRLA